MHWEPLRSRISTWSTPFNPSICSIPVMIIVIRVEHCLMLLFFPYAPDFQNMTFEMPKDTPELRHICYWISCKWTWSNKWTWDHHHCCVCSQLLFCLGVNGDDVMFLHADCFCRTVSGWTGASHSWCPLHLGNRKWSNAPLPVYFADTQNGYRSGWEPLPAGRTVQKRGVQLERLHTTEG